MHPITKLIELPMVVDPAMADSGPAREFPGSPSRRIGKLRWFGTLLPVLYIWALPILADAGFAHKCRRWPRCKNTGASVSDFIANTHATGAMAAVFFFPAMHLWLNVQAIRDRDTCAMPTLIIFQICFGFFLVCPVSEVPRLHGMAVLAFCTAGVVHNVIALRYCSRHRQCQCQALLCVALLAFAAVFLLVIISRLDPTFIPEKCPMIFYFCEAVGLSSMAVFPMLWYVETQNALEHADAAAATSRATSSSAAAGLTADVARTADEA